jgi:hypothetical protein
VSLATDRLLTVDWLPLNAWSSKARLLMLFEEDNSWIVPRTIGLALIEIYEVKVVGRFNNNKIIFKVVFLFPLKQIIFKTSYS